MKKYEQFTKEELQEFCNQSESYRELAIKIGYAADAGSATKTLKEAVLTLDLDCSHFKGQGHTKNVGKRKTPTEDYLENKVKTKSHTLRLRLLEDGIFEPICSCCQNIEWLGNPIPLELHHKDGNKENNELNNLELLCPNCHYFTDTYKSKNRKQHGRVVQLAETQQT